MYAHLLPEDLKDASQAIDNEGTASKLLRFYERKGKRKGSSRKLSG